MTMLLSEGCPPAYAGCPCSCHRIPGMVHTAACCGPMHEQLLASCLPKNEPLLGSCPDCGFVGGRHDPECPRFFQP